MFKCMVDTLRVDLCVGEDHVVMAARAAGDRVHMCVGKLLRSHRGVEVTGDVGELLVGQEVDVELSVEKESGPRVVCSC